MAENLQDHSDKLKHLAGSRPSSVTKGDTMHWFAYLGPNPPNIDEAANESLAAEDREQRVRHLRERQNEERQKKLEEIRTQTLAAQRFKEQKEQERRCRLEELRVKDDTRRHQVEERKRAINEAERDRLESILKRNQEREARIESKKRNERSSMVFAFGSSTPRMLDDLGPFCGPRRATSTQNITCAATPLTRRQSERELDGSGKKRATSAGGLERTGEDIMSMSMYEMAATSATSVLANTGRGTLLNSSHIPNYRQPGITQGITRSYSAHFGSVSNTTGTMSTSTTTTPAGCISGYVGRRRTDLVPTIPLKEPTASAAGTPRGSKPFARSPGRAYSMSRLDQLATPRKRFSVNVTELPLSPVAHPAAPPPLSRHARSNTKASSVSRSMSHLAAGGRSVLIAFGQHVSGAVGALLQQPARPLRKADSRSMYHLSATGGGQHTQQGSVLPLPPPRTTRATQLRNQRLSSATVQPSEAPSRPSSSLSQQSTTSIASNSTAVHMRPRPLVAPPPRKPRPVSIAVTGISTDLPLLHHHHRATNNGSPNNNNNNSKPPLPSSKVNATAAARKTMLVNKSQDRIRKRNSLLVSPIVSPTATDSSLSLQSTVTDSMESSAGGVPGIVDGDLSQDSVTESTVISSTPLIVDTADVANITEIVDVKSATVTIESSNETPASTTITETSTNITAVSTNNINETSSSTNNINETSTATNGVEVVNGNQTSTGNMENSLLLDDTAVDMTVSMSKVRINTEEEAKAALAEKRRLAREEAERVAESERQRAEEERRMEIERQQREEEQQRLLIEQMKQAEQKRLEEAIKQKQIEEEEERVRQEEESKQKVLKEEADRKAKEESERQKLELEERMRNEEKEREARRKRVEAIMLRTRGKNNSTSSPQSEDHKSDKINGSNQDSSENGHKNGKDIETVDNIIPVESLKNANTLHIDSLSTDDTLNSNNAWQINTQQTGTVTNLD